MRNKTVTLCGSARFEKEFHKINKYLTLRGIVVLSLACFPSQEKKKNWYNDEQKILLDLVHLKKIAQFLGEEEKKNDTEDRHKTDIK